MQTRSPPCLRHPKAYDGIGIDCPEVFDLLPEIAKAAVKNKLLYTTFMFSPTPEVIDQLLGIAEVPIMQRAAVGRVLHALAANGGSGGGNAARKRRKTVHEPRPGALKAYHQDAQNEIQRLNPPATFTLANGRKKTVPSVKKK